MEIVNQNDLKTMGKWLMVSAGIISSKIISSFKVDDVIKIRISVNSWRKYFFSGANDNQKPFKVQEYIQARHYSFIFCPPCQNVSRTLN